MPVWHMHKLQQPCVPLSTRSGRAVLLTHGLKTCAATSLTNSFSKAAWWDLSGPCMCHTDWDVTGLFTLRRGRGPTRPAALYHLSRSTPVCLSCYAFPSAADNKLSWSSSAALLLRSQPFPGLILERQKKKKACCLRIDVGGHTVTDAELSSCVYWRAF